MFGMKDIMEYFEVVLADGTRVIACDAPESYVRMCLDSTGAIFEPTTAERAAEINHYFHVNGGRDWDLLRMRALEAKIRILENK